eukprot:4506582-Heterocapsa_arctica.AAC.1
MRTRLVYFGHWRLVGFVADMDAGRKVVDRSDICGLSAASHASIPRLPTRIRAVVARSVQDPRERRLIEEKEDQRWL